ncbi:uncharacterized protein LOC130899659 isoform X2 [Diorhabda carinulata]|uniref:uncharacterized protein LOC130899659 isoform X2 n=1 Tax=Diorhabda carinulata TaxID=1163345 RepID=UPI0025A00A79|nr:uncharacterized protein LOC130899659 isoform X2 [Diorhabda carinulata]
MNFPRYEFCEENKPLLLNFIKLAKQNKLNPHCNLDEYKKLSKILPLTNAFNTSNEFSEIISISDSDEEHYNEIDINSLHVTLKNTEKTLNDTVTDLTYAIKEILETEKQLTLSIINDLHKPSLDLETLFKQLQEELNSEEIIAFGTSLNSNFIKNNAIISTYIKYLLIPQLTLDYSDQCQLNLNNISYQYPDILSDELCSYLLNPTEGYRNLQFLESLSPDFKTKLLRNFVINSNELEENHISILDILFGEKVETDTINKLIEIMSKFADSFATNKIFGKFLLKLIQLLGKQVVPLEKPMNHIIGIHRSIWKIINN